MTEQQNPAYIPTLPEVTEAYGDILTHNDKYTNIGAALGNAIISMIEAEEAGKPDDWQEVAQTRVVEGEGDADLQELFHANTFERIGIKLLPIGTYVGGLEGAQALSGKALEPTVANTELYLAFLENLEPSEVDSSTAGIKLEVDVIGSLEQTVRVCYGQLSEDISEDERTAIRAYGDDALRTFTRIQPEYERLGLDNPQIYQHLIAQGKPEFLGEELSRYYEAVNYSKTYSQLENYVEYWGRDVLSEYLRIGDELDGEIKSYYFDGLHDRLSKDVDYILSLQMDDRTKDFGTEVAQAKALSLTRTLEAIQGEPKPWYGFAGNQQLVEEQLARLKPVVDTV